MNYENERHYVFFGHHFLLLNWTSIFNITTKIIWVWNMRFRINLSTKSDLRHAVQVRADVFLKQIITTLGLQLQRLIIETILVTQFASKQRRSPGDKQPHNRKQRHGNEELCRREHVPDRCEETHENHLTQTLDLLPFHLAKQVLGQTQTSQMSEWVCEDGAERRIYATYLATLPPAMPRQGREHGLHNTNSRTGCFPLTNNL